MNERQAVINRIQHLAKVTMTWRDKPEESVCINSDEWTVQDGIKMRLCSLSGESNLTVVNVVAGEGGELPLHKHDREAKIFIVQGEYIDLVTGREYKSGECQIIPPNAWYGFHTAEGCMVSISWHPPYPQRDITTAFRYMMGSNG